MIITNNWIFFPVLNRSILLF